MISRRGLLFGAGALLAAPAIVRVSSLMPLRGNPLWEATLLNEAGDAVHRRFIEGYIEEFRLTLGEALWVENFAVAQHVTEARLRGKGKEFRAPLICGGRHGVHVRPGDSLRVALTMDLL